MTSIPIDESAFSKLAGKVVIITGGARGIGAATVEFFHSYGATVEFADLNDTNGKQLESKLASKTKYTHCDVTSWKSLSAFFKGVFERNGRIDVVVANAGIVERKEFLDDILTPDGELAEPDLSVINVNLTGCMLTGKLALWYFKKNPTPGGALVMISSVGGYMDGKGIVQYKAAKHGVIGFLRGIKHYMTETNAHVVAIAPWMTKTIMTSAFADGWIKGGFPTNEPVDISRAIATAALTPDLNGGTLWVSGGNLTEIESGIVGVPNRAHWLGKKNSEDWEKSKVFLKDYVLPDQ